ncbi:Lysophospholipase L1 [Arthrobacter sp. ok909]|uniref:SGNH/GDSL hydrolase family protein n=1 Tax=Arthrobacter sp. ok909 TaxID=1761746 RepID=UPI00088146F8|nr:SGNH/GDSL hydrolase family protein [Arthrobacter sp. ok909]SDP74587.1 Lysophospholipase L1 [Arthrobacter sp. ok909]
MTLSRHRRSTLATALGVSAVLCALAACAPAADHRLAQAGPQQSTPSPAPFQTPQRTTPERVVVIGDSLSTGFGTSPEEAWPRQLGQALQSGQHPVDIINAAKNGAGYLAAGEGGETFGSQIAATLNASTDIVVFFGSDNDAGQDPAALKAAVADALSTSKTLAPHAARIVIGPLTAFEPVKADVDVIRDQERTVALDAGAEFVDPITDHWIAGPNSSLLGPDHEHPSSQGQRFLKGMIQGILASLASPGAVSSPPEAPRQ